MDPPQQAEPTSKATTPCIPETPPTANVASLEGSKQRARPDPHVPKTNTDGHSKNTTIATTNPRITSLLQCLPEALRDIASSTGSDPDLMAATMFQAASCAAAKNWISTRSTRRLQQYPNLYVLTVTPPAAGKSAVIQSVFEPIRKIEVETMRESERKKLNLDARIKQNKWEIQEIEKAIKAGDSQPGSNHRKKASKAIAKLGVYNEQLRHDSLFLGNLIVTDASPAGIKQDLFLAPDHYIAMVQPDARDFLKGLCQPKDDAKAGGTRQFLLHLFSGDRIVISRGSGKRRRSLENPIITCCLMAQTDMALSFLAKAENSESGLVSRFLTLEFPHPTTPARTPSPNLAQRWENVIRTIYRRKLENSQPVKVRFDPQAEKCLDGLTHEYLKKAVSSGDAPAATMQRAGEQIGRLALVRALMRLAVSQGAKIDQSPCIVIEDVEAAEALFKISLATQKKILSQAWRTRAAAPAARKLELLLEKNGGSIPLSEVPKHGMGRQAVKTLIAEVPELFGIKKKKTELRGQPPKEVYLKHPNSKLA